MAARAMDQKVLMAAHADVGHGQEGAEDIVIDHLDRIDHEKRDGHARREDPPGLGGKAGEEAGQGRRRHRKAQHRQGAAQAFKGRQMQHQLPEEYGRQPVGIRQDLSFQTGSSHWPCGQKIRPLVPGPGCSLMIHDLLAKEKRKLLQNCKHFGTAFHGSLRHAAVLLRTRAKARYTSQHTLSRLL